MGRVLIAGLPVVIGQWLRRRLDGTPVTVVSDGHRVLAELGQRDVSLLVIDHNISDPPAPEVIHQARCRLGLGDLPAFYCLNHEQEKALPNPLRRELGLGRVLYHPLEMTELLHQIAAALGSCLGGPPGKDAEEPADVKAGIAAIWRRSRTAALGRVSLMERAIAALASDSLPEELRRQAEEAAHKLAGMAGTFGFPRVTELARDIEEGLQHPPGPKPDEAKRLAHLADQLRDELERCQGDPPG